MTMCNRGVILARSAAAKKQVPSRNSKIGQLRYADLLPYALRRRIPAESSIIPNGIDVLPRHNFSVKPWQHGPVTEPEL